MNSYAYTLLTTTFHNIVLLDAYRQNLSQRDKYFCHTGVLMMRKTTKHLRTTKSFRFTPSLAHSLHATARQLNLSDSEFVRMAMMEVIDRIQQN